MSSEIARSPEALPVPPQREPAFLEALEAECIALAERMAGAARAGAWSPSPVEERDRRLREALLRTPGVLRSFRRSFLAAGRLNFPDSPRPKEHYLAWGRRLPTAGQYLVGAWHLARMLARLYREIPFRLIDLHDNDVGEPSSFNLPRVSSAAAPRSWRLTEAQLRHFYYRSRVIAALGTRYRAVVEIGGGFGGLAAELLCHASIDRYYVIELPDAAPLATYYLRACFNCRVQAVFEEGGAVDPRARIVVLVPWTLPAVSEAVDLVINTMSFQHMDRRNLEFYFGEVGRLAARHLFLVNRNAKRDPTDIVIDEYPIPSRYRLVSDRQFLFGAHRERLYAWE